MQKKWGFSCLWKSLESKNQLISNTHASQAYSYPRLKTDTDIFIHMYERQYLHVSAKHVTMQVLGLENLAKNPSLFSELKPDLPPLQSEGLKTRQFKRAFSPNYEPHDHLLKTGLQSWSPNKHTWTQDSPGSESRQETSTDPSRLHVYNMSPSRLALFVAVPFCRRFFFCKGCMESACNGGGMLVQKC